MALAGLNSLGMLSLSILRLQTSPIWRRCCPHHFSIFVRSAMIVVQLFPWFFQHVLWVDWLCALRVCSDRAQRKARRHKTRQAWYWKTSCEIECVHRMRLLRFCAVRRSRRKNPTESVAIQMKLIFTSRRRAFSVLTQNGTRHRNRIVFSSPLCCQSPSLCRMENGKLWTRWGPASKTQMTTIHMATFCRRGWVT